MEQQEKLRFVTDHFLSRYSGNTKEAYALDLRIFFDKNTPGWGLPNSSCVAEYATFMYWVSSNLRSTASMISGGEDEATAIGTYVVLTDMCAVFGHSIDMGYTPERFKSQTLDDQDRLSDRAAEIQGETTLTYILHNN
jgi:hypothetical protein